MLNCQRPSPNAQCCLTAKRIMTTHTATEAPSKTKIRPHCLGVSVCRFVFVTASYFVLATVGWLSPVAAQQLLDQVAARVGTSAITKTDVDAAVAFGIVDKGQGDVVQQVIDRRLMLGEVDKFKPPDPADADVGALVAKMKTVAGSDVNAIMKRTGVDEKRLTELARDTLRLQTYVAQRFGSGDRAAQQIARWIEDLRARGDVMVINSRQ